MNTPSPFLPLLKDGEDKSCPLKNRIRKNYQALRKWGNKTNTNCFRIYDKDIKEFPVAIDYYDQRFCVHYYVSSRDEETPSSRISDAVNFAICSLFGSDSKNIYWRSRFKREKIEQYEKADLSQESFIVNEYGVKFEVNLKDYLDTGLFLDHRETRQRVAKEAARKHLLNLFSYTGAFSVHAALSGALSTTSVDLSNTYTAWNARNFALNHISSDSNQIIRADCLQYLNECKDREYDIIVLDPPTLSRSKKMTQMFDIQWDYIPLIKKTVSLLSQSGILYFSNNCRQFKFDVDAFPECTISDITDQTIPLDFRNHKIHSCWKITKKSIPLVGNSDSC